MVVKVKLCEKQYVWADWYDKLCKRWQRYLLQLLCVRLQFPRWECYFLLFVGFSLFSAYCLHLSAQVCYWLKICFVHYSPGTNFDFHLLPTMTSRNGSNRLVECNCLLEVFWRASNDISFMNCKVKRLKLDFSSTDFYICIFTTWIRFFAVYQVHGLICVANMGFPLHRRNGLAHRCVVGSGCLDCSRER